ncbi:hypothetical protein [Flavobacterium tyrosinilyticum]|uniref:hypothetical protein n=1 Tax=Flavobacterium tyrosinilyticum TaxID=1658740 RepID=UPI00202EFC13|nr:hypothetical protein [Flavobacterium tyrosinilyticum]MCM0665318.1 hypothetical protein [Flavobacterium tyrosinilyticum]
MKKIIFLLLFFGLFSCERKEPNFSEEMIEKLANEDHSKDGIVRLDPYNFLEFYVLIDNNEVHRSFKSELWYIHNKYYAKEFRSFKTFLDAVLNKSFVIEKKRLKKITHFESFKLNSKIEKEYTVLGFDNFLKKYSKETASKRVALNRAIIKDDEYSTVVYLLFKNRYDISSDCYLGIDFVRKREDFFK